jgi:uncharacterized protein YqeY
MLSRIEQEIKKSMIAKQQARLGVLRMVKADIINNSKTAKPKDEMSVVNDYLKKLQKVKEVNIANNIDSTELDNEMSVVAEFLPTPVTEVEVEAELKEIMKTESNIGPIMSNS